MPRDRVFARIRKDDTIIKEHFENIKDSDTSYEVRRLLEKAILIERKEKQVIENISKNVKQEV